jgi:hypothetical protein
MRTKWQIIVAEVEELKAKLAALQAHMEWAEKTPVWPGKGGVECVVCGEKLRTEKDFADHFLVPDEANRNLGYCPKTVGLKKG